MFGGIGEEMDRWLQETTKTMYLAGMGVGEKAVAGEELLDELEQALERIRGIRSDVEDRLENAPDDDGDVECRSSREDAEDDLERIAEAQEAVEGWVRDEARRLFAEYAPAYLAVDRDGALKALAVLVVEQDTADADGDAFDVVCDAPQRLLKQMVETSTDPVDWTRGDRRFDFSYPDIGDWEGYVYASAQELMHDVDEAAGDLRRESAIAEKTRAAAGGGRGR